MNRRSTSKVGHDGFLAAVLVVGGVMAALGVAAFGGDDASDQSIAATQPGVGPAGQARSSADQSSQAEHAGGSSGPVPSPDLFPDFPATAELEAAAARIPEDQRQPFAPGDRWAAPQLTDYPSIVPVFMNDSGELAGIYVPGVGIVSREVYENPATDYDAVRVERLGPEVVARTEQRRAEIDSCLNAALDGERDLRAVC